MILGVLLAAGSGSRFDDGHKLLADLEGTPVVAQAANSLLESSVEQIVAVVGHRDEEVAAVLELLGVECVRNPDFGVGQSTSVHVGVAAARDRDADAVLFALADAPCVHSETIDTLIDTFQKSDATILVPTNEGRRGNPVIFDQRHYDALAATSGDAGGRTLFETNSVKNVSVDDPGIHLDVDTKSDLEALRQRCSDSTRE